jgi:hypothetical protein
MHGIGIIPTFQSDANGAGLTDEELLEIAAAISADPAKV